MDLVMRRYRKELIIITCRKDYTMGDFQLDYSDITDIFKEKLKVENIVKTVSTIFQNHRFSSKIDYKPYFQRNYVWDDEKASYFIESILLGTEIPPLVLFQTKDKNEVIDGRQRYETIERFLNDKLVLNEKGLHSLKSLAGKRYTQISEDVQDSFCNTRIRILQFRIVNEPELEETKEDKIKKEIFRRYNSGITPLIKYDIARAAYNDDVLSRRLNKYIDNDVKLYDFLRIIMVPKSKMKASKRDQVNILVTLIRNLITLPLIPINIYSRASSKAELVHQYYAAIISQDNPDTVINRFREVIELLRKIYEASCQHNIVIKENKLFYETMYWGLSIILDNDIEVSDKNIKDIINILDNASEENIWINIKDNNIHDIAYIFESTGSHYYSAINNRYTFIANVLEEVFQCSLLKYVKNKQIEELVDDTKDECQEVRRYKLNKPLPETLTIEDILSEMRRSRFLIRPDYQRSEVKNIQKASYLMESILLDFRIPPLFVYKRTDDRVREVVDGQQRLLTILGFLGKTYRNEKDEFVASDKDKFKLSKLRILEELNGKNIENVGEIFENKILEFPMDIIEIDGEQNPDFNPIDLFLRLNTKPYPIHENSFEMWNAYIDKNIAMMIKEIAKKYQGTIFRSIDIRMKLEELITSLAYLDYRMKRGDSFVQIVNIYKRNNRMCARITSKEQMTKVLSDASQEEPDVFLQSVESVEIFVEKVLNLLEQNVKKLRDLMNHSKKGTGYKTDQNYYFLWILLREISNECINEKREKIYCAIQQIFTDIQNVPLNVEVDTFVKKITGWQYTL